MMLRGNCIVRRLRTRRVSGFSLIEVLVAVLVVAVGVLGIAGLQLVTLRVSTGSVMRTQANQLAYNIVDRMRANPAANYAIGMGDDAPAIVRDCEALTCNAIQMVAFDTSGWLNDVAALPSGDGSIAVAGGIVTVTLQWDDDNQPANPLTTMEVRTQLRGVGP